MDLNSVVRQIKKGLDNLNFEKAVKHSTDETRTRDYLINPFFENVLNYDKIDDFLPEYYADMVGKRRKKVDMAINFGQSNPIIFVECKKANEKLDNHIQQLFNYCLPSKSVKFGILTDGIEYNFFTANAIKESYPVPFLKFNLNDYKTSDVESLALFYKQFFNPTKINDFAEEIYFNEKFENALFDVLTTKDSEFAKLISKHMGISRANDNLKKKILNSVNSISLGNIVNKITNSEIHQNNSGIITTNEELKFFSIVKTILAIGNSKINKQIERIVYKDFKTIFTILVDGNQNKNICSLHINKTSQYIVIDGEKFNISEVSSVEITKLKKQLISSALKQLEIS